MRRSARHEDWRIASLDSVVGIEDRGVNDRAEPLTRRIRGIRRNERIDENLVPFEHLVHGQGVLGLCRRFRSRGSKRFGRFATWVAYRQAFLGRCIANRRNPSANSASDSFGLCPNGIGGLPPHERLVIFNCQVYNPEQQEVELPFLMPGSRHWSLIHFMPAN